MMDTDKKPSHENVSATSTSRNLTRHSFTGVTQRVPASLLPSLGKSTLNPKPGTL